MIGEADSSPRQFKLQDENGGRKFEIFRAIERGEYPVVARNDFDMRDRTCPPPPPPE